MGGSVLCDATAHPLNAQTNTMSRTRRGIIKWLTLNKNPSRKYKRSGGILTHVGRSQIYWSMP
ncbi:MAG: hypothetical protein AVDCRST_MAG93-6196 [uncultured Chloroflexia bacterium]|uniref:Uncharacterized protein n=1 Tax=uncultured Chloroflexia bacterium TaxID=1672391 RepID=A0A6J4LFM7_9CHLR|nr:MAG: hypothetical protein AVDCRST_MAG93-6196 [uncultured Chloroflexia bacterium]